MLKEYLLSTHGYQVRFRLVRIDPDEGYGDVVVELIQLPTMGNIVVRSIPAWTRLRDIQKLALYFGNHIRELKSDEDHISDEFITIGLNFVVQALEGSFDPAIGGEFKLRFMVNVGRSPMSNVNVYWGSETEVDIDEIKEFCSKLEGIVS